MLRDLDHKFDVECGQLVRVVNPKRGKPYVHRCDEAVYKQVAEFIDDVHHHPDDAVRVFDGAAVIKATGAPQTQVYTALAFLGERGLVVDGPRKGLVANGGYDDAMCEWYAMAERSPGSACSATWGGAA